MDFEWVCGASLAAQKAPLQSSGEMSLQPLPLANIGGHDPSCTTWASHVHPL